MARKRTVKTAIGIEVDRVETDLFGESQVFFRFTGKRYDHESEHTNPAELLHRLKNAGNVYLIEYEDAESPPLAQGAR